VTEILRIDPREPDPSTIERAAEVIRRGGTVAFPTETVYGLGADALDAAAVQRVFEAKRRAPDDPLIVHVATPTDLSAVAARIPSAARPLIDAFWPGALTLIVPKRPSIPASVTAGLDTVAVRCPAHPVAVALIAAAGRPVVAPSANAFTRTSATTAQHVMEDLDGRIDMVLDGGPADAGIESTVLDITSRPPRLLRPGAVPREAIEAVVGPILVGGKPRSASPGQLALHYAPRTPLLYARGDEAAVGAWITRELDNARVAGQRVGLLLPDEVARAISTGPHVIVERLGSRRDPATVASRLFGAMRRLDRAGVNLLLATDVGQVGLGLAIRDRLTRAAGGKVVELPSA
jgi:L-threonylcarbamoyladenylate synthase